MVGLNSLWYKDYPRSKFHFFNDNREWLQMDKIGHGVTTYYLGKQGMDLMRWTGASEKQNRWLGGGIGFFYLTTIEVLDGFSEGWGASWGDLVANTAGTAVLIGTDALWTAQRNVPKYT